MGPASANLHNSGLSNYEHVTFNHGVEGSSPSALTMFLQQNLHFPKFSSGVFVRAVGKLCAPVGKLLFRSCSVTVAARCSVAPGSGGYLVDLPSRYETRLPRWGDGKLAVGSPRRRAKTVRQC
jgi:hypothetical protein